MATPTVLNKASDGVAPAQPSALNGTPSRPLSTSLPAETTSPSSRASLIREAMLNARGHLQPHHEHELLSSPSLRTAIFRCDFDRRLVDALILRVRHPDLKRTLLDEMISSPGFQTFNRVDQGLILDIQREHWKEFQAQQRNAASTATASTASSPAPQRAPAASSISANDQMHSSSTSPKPRPGVIQSAVNDAQKAGGPRVFKMRRTGARPGSTSSLSNSLNNTPSATRNISPLAVADKPVTTAGEGQNRDPLIGQPIYKDPTSGALSRLASDLGLNSQLEPSHSESPKLPLEPRKQGFLAPPSYSLDPVFTGISVDLQPRTGRSALTAPRRGGPPTKRHKPELPSTKGLDEESEVEIPDSYEKPDSTPEVEDVLGNRKSAVLEAPRPLVVSDINSAARPGETKASPKGFAAGSLGAHVPSRTSSTSVDDVKEISSVVPLEEASRRLFGSANPSPVDRLGKEVPWELSPQPWIPESTREPGELIMATHDRPYKKVEVNGKLESSRGALIPILYKPLHTEYPHTPWICPVRVCRRLLKTISGLGGHFSAAHQYREYNDNGDGTISELRPRRGGKDNCSIVVSKNIRHPNELEPLAEPAEPDWRAPKAGLLNESRPSSETQSGYTTPKAVVVSKEPSVHEKAQSSEASETRVIAGHKEKPSSVDEGVQSSKLSFASLTNAATKGISKPLPAHKLKGGAKELWDYITPFLSKTSKQTVPYKGYIQQFLQFPRIRDIEWNPSSKHRYQDSQPKDVCSLLMQLTGDEMAEPCSRCQEGRGPYARCIAVPIFASVELQQVIYSCANCYYHSCQTYCPLQPVLKARCLSVYPHAQILQTEVQIQGKPGHKKKSLGVDNGRKLPLEIRPLAASSMHLAEDGGPRPGPKPKPSEDNIYSSIEMDIDIDMDLDDLDSRLENSTVSRRSERLVIKESAAEANKSPMTGTMQRPSKSVAPSSQWDDLELDADDDGVGAGAGALMQHGEMEMVASDALEMEDWEVAPGRIRDESTSKTDNIAFSNAFLTSSEMVPVSNDVYLRVEVLGPGAQHRFEPDSRLLRICSVATGKLRVRLDGSEFDIGANGAIKIRPGSECIVENRMYITAHLHVSGFNGRP